MRSIKIFFYSIWNTWFACSSDLGPQQALTFLAFKDASVVLIVLILEANAPAVRDVLD